MSISIDFYVCASEMNENTWAHFFLQLTSEVLIVEKTIVAYICLDCQASYCFGRVYKSFFCVRKNSKKGASLAI